MAYSEPTPKAKRTSKEEADFVAGARDRLNTAIEAMSQNRQWQVDDLRFAAGSPDNKTQWDLQVLAKRQNDPNGPRPCLTINKLPQHIFQITNEQRQNRPSIKVMPVDGNADKEVAEILNGIVRHIEYNSDADVAYSTAGEGQTQVGEGYIRVLTDYVDEMSFEQEILICQVKNPFSVYLDPIGLQRDATGRYCDWGFIIDDLSEAEFKRRWPKASPINWELVGNGNEWKAWFPDGKTVRIAEYFYCEYESATICMYADGSVVLKSDEVAAKRYEQAGIEKVGERQTKVKQWRWCKLNGQEELEKQDWAGKYIPVVRIIGNEWMIDGKLQTAGIVRNAKDAQRMFNYWKSTETEMLALAPKAPFVGPAEAFDGYEDDWQSANTKNLAYLKYNQFGENNERLDRPTREQPPMPPVGIVNAALGAADDIKSATGQYDPSLGNNPQAKSGVALAREQRKTDIGTYQYQDNQARGIRQLGRIIIDLAPKIYDTRRVIRILGEDGETDHVTIDPEQQVPMMEMPNERGGVDKIYNLGIGTYDVRASVGPSYTSKRQEAAEFMAQVLQGNKELMAVMGDLYFEMLDVPGADKIAERLKKALPPGLADDPEDGEAPAMVQTPQGPVPVEQAGQMIAQLMQAQEQMAQALEQADVMKQQAAGMKAENDRLSTEIDGFRAETERLGTASTAALNEAKIKEIAFNAIKEYVDRTPVDDSGLLSPLHKPEKPAPAGAPQET